MRTGRQIKGDQSEALCHQNLHARHVPRVFISAQQTEALENKLLSCFQCVGIQLAKEALTSCFVQCRNEVVSEPYLCVCPPPPPSQDIEQEVFPFISDYHTITCTSLCYYTDISIHSDTVLSTSAKINSVWNEFVAIWACVVTYVVSEGSDVGGTRPLSPYRVTKESQLLVMAWHTEHHAIPPLQGMPAFVYHNKPTYPAPRNKAPM